MDGSCSQLALTATQHNRNTASSRSLSGSRRSLDQTVGGIVNFVLISGRSIVGRGSG